jgi:hypothetical protein
MIQILQYRFANYFVCATIEMAYAVKSEKIFRDFNQMEAIKSVLLETLPSKTSAV